MVADVDDDHNQQEIEYKRFQYSERRIISLYLLCSQRLVLNRSFINVFIIRKPLEAICEKNDR